MMKRIVSLLLICIMTLSVPLTVAAESNVITVDYYSIDMQQNLLDNEVYTEKVDLMIYPSKNEVYITNPITPVSINKNEWEKIE